MSNNNANQPSDDDLPEGFIAIEFYEDIVEVDSDSKEKNETTEKESLESRVNPDNNFSTIQNSLLKVENKILRKELESERLKVSKLKSEKDELQKNISFLSSLMNIFDSLTSIKKSIQDIKKEVSIIPRNTFYYDMMAA